MSQTHSRLFRSASTCLTMLALSLQPSHLWAAGQNIQSTRHTSLMPASAISPQRSLAEPQVADIELIRSDTTVGQVLLGQIVNEAGQGIADVTVQLSDGKQIWQGSSDAHGEFQLTGLRGGSYQFRTTEETQMVRVWSAGTAPPHASKGILISPTTEVVRGQRVVSPNTNQFFRVAKQRLANPWVVGGIVATAVAIPVGIHNAEDDDPPATP